MAVWAVGLEADADDEEAPAKRHYIDASKVSKSTVSRSCCCIVVVGPYCC